MKNKPLSKKGEDSLSLRGIAYREKDVKEAVEKLKEDICNWLWEGNDTYEEIKPREDEMKEFIDNIFGNLK
ncbi:MAG TPA: hypothetical protein VMZ91_03380 [Candidatus Paceibacterota bacterium]|nr:hypothetical protein [Candidatus Paceibacterota bacterium]